MNRQFETLDINHIVVKPRIRKDNGDLTALEHSIGELGLLHPVIVDRNNILIAGGRRIEACRRAGVLSIPAIKIDIDYDSMTSLDIQSAENLCRIPLSGDELEEHIKLKKSAMGRANVGAKGRSWLKKIFGVD